MPGLCFPTTVLSLWRVVYAEFAFEIGSGLLEEVRRLQSVLGERDKVIQDIKEEKDDLGKTVESLRSGLRAQEQSAGESWMLFISRMC